jgi:N-acetyl-anhydromuramyl-L-alanine amidase AmpD
LRLFDLSLESVFSHRQLNDTDCPGHLFPWEEFLEMIGE